MRRTPVIIAALVALSASAEVSVSKIFNSHMVLQRDKPLPVWGKANPGDEIKVSFAGQSVSAKANEDGDWQATLKPLAVNKVGSDFTVTGPDNTIAFTDVLVGDVWLCSGQSNMEMSFAWGVYDGDKFKAESPDFPMIRHVKIRRVKKIGPEPYDVPVELSWLPASNMFHTITATGYFFARKLTQELDIPIGLLNASWSGCKIEPFISFEGFHMSDGLAAYADKVDAINVKTEKGYQTMTNLVAAARKWADDAEKAIAEGRTPANQLPQMPGVDDCASQYNWMINPITRFPIKGAIWYQGCSNGGEGDSYISKTEGLVLGWRKAWGYEFPFYWVQLASFTGATDDPAGGNGYANIRDAQRKALRIPQTGMAVAIDVGNPGDIHPKAKLFVGERLAAWALAKDYGKDVIPSGPLFKSAEIENDGLDADVPSVRVKFDYTGSGLMVGKKDWGNNDPVTEDIESQLQGFALRDSKDKWHWAKAEISGKDVIVSSDEVPVPTAIRYAFRANPLGKCNLYNKEGLPASPFSEKVIGNVEKKDALVDAAADETAK